MTQMKLFESKLELDEQFSAFLSYVLKTDNNYFYFMLHLAVIFIYK